MFADDSDAHRLTLPIGLIKMLVPLLADARLSRRGCKKMEESSGNAGVLAYCRSFVPNEKMIRQDRGRDSRLGQPSYKNLQPRRVTQ
jgi:hypothetical protein